MRHFVRYHTLDENNPIESRPGNWFAYFDHDRSANWTSNDLIWLVSGERKTWGMVYRVEYFFHPETTDSPNGGRRYVRGTKGKFLESRPIIGNESWWREFQTSIGNGGLSIVAVKPDFGSYFDGLLEQSVQEDEDGREAEDERWAGESIDDTQLRAIKTRRGQPKFRAALLKAYGQRCAMTGCTAVDVLEAAHIRPHSEETDYRVCNGVLLRADIHTLFDYRKISVNPDARFRIVVARALEGTEYWKLRDKEIALPDKPSDTPSTALAWHYREFQERESLATRS